MKKLLSVFLSICLLTGVFSFYSYAAPLTDELTVEQFAGELSALEKEYDGKYVGEIFLEDGSDTYKVGNEEFEIDNETASVDNGEIDIPVSILTEYSVDKAESEMLEVKSRYLSDTQNVKDYAETLGYDIIDHGDKATLKQTYQTHRLIVKSKKSINYLDAVDVIEGYNDLHIVQFDNLESTVNALDYYNNCKDVEFAEPDTVMHSSGYGWHQSWGSDFVCYDSFIDSMEDTTNLPTLVVAVVDSGIELTHYLLQGRIIQTGFNTSGSGDSNSEIDDNGHGTHVAGIVVDNTTDNVMVAGYKCLDNTGYGALSQVCLCVDKAVQDGVDIINMSLSEEGQSTLMETSVHNAVEHGIPVVVAAGNDSDDAANYNPANIDECITVAALKVDTTYGYNNPRYMIADFSNYGSCVDVIAPGNGIGSAYIGNTTESLNGTSMAAPFVCAAMSLLLSCNPTLTEDDMLQYLEENAYTNWIKPSPNSVPNCFCLKLGAAEGLGNPAPRTAQPTFSVTPGTYTHSILLELYCEEPADIFYTTDGTSPTTTNGKLYTEPILIREDTNIKAAAFADGKKMSIKRGGTFKVSIHQHDPVGNFTIDDEGFITSYTGSDVNVTVPNTVDNVTVTGIGKNAFYNNATLQTVSLPSTVTCIGDYSFYHCTSLTAVSGSNLSRIGDYAFYACGSLTEFNACNTKSIGDYAFYSCQNLTQVSGTNIQLIGKYAFCSCMVLQSIYSSNIKSVADYAFRYCNFSAFDFTKVKYIGNSSFRNCSNLASVSNNLVETIYPYAFANNPLLTNVSFTNAKSVYDSSFLSDYVLETLDMQNVEFLDKNVFKECRTLLSATFPNLIQQSVDGYQFYGCYGLKTVNMPKIKSVEMFEFANCYALQSVNLPLVESIERLGFSSCKDALETINLPNLLSLGHHAFNFCSKLKNVSMPKLTSLDTDGNQFYNCSALQFINLPNLTGDCPTYAFYNTQLKTAVLPKVTSFGEFALPLQTIELLYIPCCTFIGSDAFNTVASSNTITLFAPSLTYMNAFPSAPSFVIYCTNKVYYLPSMENSPTTNQVTVYAPAGTYAEDWADENSQTFYDAYSIGDNSVDTPTPFYNGGIRMACTFSPVIDFQNYASNINYGFEYNFNGEYKSLPAENKTENFGTAYSNILITGIKQNEINNVIRVKAVTDIDGMIFKKPEKVFSYSQLNLSTVNAYDVNRDSLFNDEDLRLIGDIAVGITNPSSLSTVSRNIADKNNDSVIDGFDLAIFDRRIKTYFSVSPEDNLIAYSA